MAKKIISLILVTIVYGIQGQEETGRLPRCSEHEILNGIGKIADPLNSKGYFICENDILTLKYCESTEVFDAKLNECKSLGETVGETDTRLLKKSQNNLTSKYDAYKSAREQLFGSQYSNFQCPSKKTKNYPDEQDCRKYYHCEEQIPRNFTCPTYFLFDVKTLQCQFFLLAICSQQPTTIAPTTYNPPNCTHDEDIPYPYDCKHYFHCSGSNGSLKKCGWFFSFDPDKRKCRFSLFVRCDVSGKSYSITKYLAKISEYISYPFNFMKDTKFLSDTYDTSDRNFKYFAVDQSVTLYESSDVPQCGENDVFRKPYPGHCKRFYNCNHGVLKVYKCLFIFNFDPIILKCKWFSHVDCNYAPPTPSTTTLTTEVSSTSVLTSLESSTTTSGVISSSSVSSSSTTGVISSSSVSSSSKSGEISSSSVSSSSTSGEISSSSVSSSSTSGEISSSSVSSSSTSGEISSSSVSSSSTTLGSDKPSALHNANYKKLSSSNRMKITGNKLKMFNFNYKNDEFVCRPHGIYDDVYPRNCHKYYHCDEGNLAIDSCSFFKDFDPIEKRCRLFFLVECHPLPEVVTTTEGPPTFSTETPIIISTVYPPEPTTWSPSTTNQPEPTTWSPSTTNQPEPTRSPSTTNQPEPTTWSPSTTNQPEPTTWLPSTTNQPTTDLTTRHPHPTKITHRKKTKKHHRKTTTHRTSIEHRFSLHDEKTYRTD